jgi:hypothetical protein
MCDDHTVMAGGETAVPEPAVLTGTTFLVRLPAGVVAERVDRNGPSLGGGTLLSP